MPLIKSADAPTAKRFQWLDIEAEADALLDTARSRAEEIIAQARQEAQAIRDAARQEGFDLGRREGLPRGADDGPGIAVEEHRQELCSAIKLLSHAAKKLAAAHECSCADSVGAQIELAIAIARRVTKRQAMIDPQVLVENLRESLALAGRSHRVRIAIHPAQQQVLAEALPRLKLDWPSLCEAQIVEDASMGVGGCRVYTEHGCIDADLRGQLDRVISQLMPPRASEEPTG